MQSTLYALNEGKVSEFNAAHYNFEGELQKIISDNPELLSLPSDPNDYKLFLVGTEQVVNSSADATGYIDVLFIDSNAVPVIVEVKLSSNYEIHRKIVGQLLYYAANIRSLSLDSICTSLRENNDLDNTVVDFTSEDFTVALSENINNNRLRLIFVADRFPEDLKTVIRFLNGSMTDVVVYGVELSQYQSSGEVFLSKEIVGFTDNSKTSVKPATNSKAWFLDEIYKVLSDANSINELNTLEQLVQFSRENGLVIKTGKGLKQIGVVFKFGIFTLFELYLEASKNYEGIIYLKHNEFAKINKTFFPDKNSVVSYLENNGFETSLFKVGINYTTFKTSLLNDTKLFAKFKNLILEACAG